MEKIKLFLNVLKNKTIKYQGQKIEVKPYIDRKGMVVLTNLALTNYKDNEDMSMDKFQLISDVKISFDIAVLEMCTNIDLKGLEINDILISGLIENVTPHIINYNAVWEIVRQAMMDKNTYEGLGILSKAMPTAEEMSKNFQEMEKVLELLNNKPELLKEVLDISNLNNAKEIVKAEKQSKNKTKKKG